jgi:hypothetical protein
MITIRPIAVLLVLALATTSYAASDPPQVGEMVCIPLKTSATGLTWGVSALRNGSPYANITSQVTVNERASFLDGLYEAVWTPGDPGEYQLLFTPSSGSPISWYESIVAHSQGDIYTAIYDSYTGIDNRLTASHGQGPWNAAGSVTVVPFQGSVSYESAALGSDVHVVRGDSVAIPYQAGVDLTGWEVWFGAKANPADTTYSIGPVNITGFITDTASGTGLINLTSSQTDVTPRRYFAEIELRNGEQVLTPLRFYLWLDPDVLR